MDVIFLNTAYISSGGLFLILARFSVNAMGALNLQSRRENLLKGRLLSVLIVYPLRPKSITVKLK